MRCLGAFATAFVLCVGASTAQGVHVARDARSWVVGHQDFYANLGSGGIIPEPVRGWVDICAHAHDYKLQVGIDNWDEERFLLKPWGVEEPDTAHAVFSRDPSGGLLARLVEASLEEGAQGTSSSFTVDLDKVWFEVGLQAASGEPGKAEAVLSLYSEHTFEEKALVAQITLTAATLDPGLIPVEEGPGPPDQSKPGDDLNAYAPEPTTIGLLLFALGGLGVLKSRRARSS